ncbi:hypothetical protein CHS0354_001104 [Potamilus streckersoni]|uniref:Inner centromere protein ARK-binding domain-containing protein n=1 Tax=Potamilus streckersoni TaxID=2493646 RepID=A0AAE0RVR2_9BIVA|nr:hypothetical protein CHS0354_001104 [Potamilus streckersoni]
MADLPFYIGFQTNLDIRLKVEEIFMRFEEEAFGYLSEILATAKKTFKSSKIEPLPKTPSAKRSRRKITRRKIEELNEEDEENNPPAKRLSLHPETDNLRDDSPQRHTRITRAAAKRATTSSRTRKKSGVNRNEKDQSEKNKSTPIICVDKVVQKEILECETKVTRESKHSPLSSVQEQLKQSYSPQKPLHKFCLMNVKEKASVYEEMIHLIENNAVHQSHKTPTASPSKRIEENHNSLKIVCSNYRSGSIHRSGSNRKASHLDTPKATRRSSRASVRKSLQMVKSHQALKKSGTFEKLKVTPSTKPSRTRLRLKKMGAELGTSRIDTGSTKENEDENAHNAHQEFSNIQETNAEDNATEATSKRSIQTNVQKSDSNSSCAAEISTDVNIEAASYEVLPQTSSHTDAQIGVGNTSLTSHDAADSENTCTEVSMNKSKMAEIRKPSTADGESADLIEITQNKGISLENDSCKNVKCNENEGSSSRKDIDGHQPLSVKPVRSTRTRQRVAERTADMSTNSQLERNSQSDVDSGVGSVTKVSLQESIEDKPRVTRSKMRKPNSNSGTDELGTSSDHDEVFAVPNSPPPRMTRTKTRKRQLEEESDTEIDTSKRSHLDSETSDQEKKDEESYMGVTTDEELHEDAVSRSLFTPATKIIHPASFLNSLNKTSANSALCPANLATGIVRSFIKRNTPPKPTLEDLHNRRKMALEEKERLHQERLKNREVQYKRKMEELKRKREEKMKKAAELREKLHSEESKHRMLLNRKMHLKEQKLESMKEEKLKEEREKQKIRQQKLQEAEERRLQEQKELEKKVQEQLAERKHRELLQKKKEMEEFERLQKLQQESQKFKEKLAEIEKERATEAEKLRLIEEEKQREWQRKKDERERMLIQEKAEKERIELEKKRERELQMKKEIDRQKELEKRRLEEEEQQKEKERQMQEELKKQLNKHNAQLIQQQQQNNVTHTSLKGIPKPNLNRTLTLTEPQIVKTLASNPNSYEMTPVRMHKNSPSEDNYDISNLHSDDSTDDEDAPRKKIPLWAQGANLKAALINQHYHPPNLERMFSHIDPPDLNLLFEKKRARFNKRTSSAHWDSPILLPCKI